MTMTTATITFERNHDAEVRRAFLTALDGWTVRLHIEGDAEAIEGDLNGTAWVGDHAFVYVTRDNDEITQIDVSQINVMVML